MADKFINEIGLAYFYNRLKTVFATKGEVGDKNVIETVEVNGAALTPDAQKAVNIIVPTKTSDLNNDSGFQNATQVQALIDSTVTRAYKYKGSVATYADLPSSGQTVGDVYDVQDTGMNYAWNETAWDSLGQLVDTSLLWAKSELVAMTTAEIDAILNA